MGRRHGHLYTHKKSTSSCFLCLVGANFPQAEKCAMASVTCLYQALGGTTATAYIILQVPEKLRGLKNSNSVQHEITCCHADTPQCWLQHLENHQGVCPYLEGDKSFPLVLLRGCAVHPLHHWVFNEDRYSPQNKRGEEVQVNIIPRAMQMSVKRKNQLWSTAHIKIAPLCTGLREGTVSRAGNQEVAEEIP